MNEDDPTELMIMNDFPTLPIEDWINYHPFACCCDECWYNWDEDEDEQ